MKLTGDNEKFNDFRKLIGDKIVNARLLEVFDVVTE